MSQTQTNAHQEMVYRTPSWVKRAGVGIVIALVILGILLATGEHGPSRHTPPNHSTNVQTPTAQHSAPHP